MLKSLRLSLVPSKIHSRTENRLFATSSHVDQGDPEQEQREHGNAEHGLCLAGDHRDGTGSHDEPHGGGGVTADHERSESTCTAERRRDIGHADTDGDQVCTGENPREAEEEQAEAAGAGVDHYARADRKQHDGEADGHGPASRIAHRRRRGTVVSGVALC